MATNFEQLDLSGYVTNEELEEKGYLTTVPDGYLQENGDGSNLTVQYTTQEQQPAPGAALSAFIGWLINTVGQIGALSSLATTAKSTIVAAVNELFSNIGNLSDLNTSAKGSAVAAINEVLAGIPGIIIVDVPASVITANVTYNDGLDTSLFAIDLPASLGISGQTDYRNTILVYGYVFNYGSESEQTLKQYLLSDRKTPEIVSGIYDGFAIDASMTPSGSLECTLTAGVYNDTNTSIFKSQAGNLMILVGLKNEMTVKTGTT